MRALRSLVAALALAVPSLHGCASEAGAVERDTPDATASVDAAHDADPTAPGDADADATATDATVAIDATTTDATVTTDATTTDATVTTDATDAADVDAPDPLATCRGTTVPLDLVHALPYATAAVGAAHGAFLLDWATTASAIDPRAFVPSAPAPVAGTTDRWAGFSFFGPWGTVVLAPQDFSGFPGPPPQAGILGTDFLSLDVFVVDWDRAELSRAEPGAACSDAAFREAGLRPLSSAGHFAKDLDDLDPGVPNVPTVPVRIGAATAPGQLDTGYDDHLVGPAVNVNRAFFDAIAAAGTTLTRAAALDLVLTTCTGVPEPVTAWRVPAGQAVELVGEDGTAVRREPTAIIFLKETPAGAQVCGGIGTWTTAAAQLGVSFVARAGRAALDPERSRVWLQAGP